MRKFLWWLIIGIITFVFVIIPLFLFVAWQNRDDIIDASLTYLKTTELYKTSNISFDSSYVTLNQNHLSLAATGVRFHKKISQINDTTALYAIGNIDSIGFSKVDYLSILSLKHLNVKEIIFNGGKIHCYQKRDTVNIQQKLDEEEHEEPLVVLKRLKVSTTLFSNLDFSYSSNQQDTSFIKNTHLAINNVTYSPKKGLSSLKNKDVRLHTNQIVFHTDGPYYFELAKVNTTIRSLKNWDLDLNQFKLKTYESISKLGNRETKAKAYQNLNVSNISIKGQYNFLKASKDTKLSIESLSITNPDIAIYKKTALPLDSNKVFAIIPVMIKSIPIPLHLKQANVINGHIHLIEKAKQDKPPFQLHLRKINATLSNINSRAKKGKLKISLKTLLHSDYRVAINIESNYPNEFYQFSGQILPRVGTSVNLTNWNTILPTIAGVKVKKGYLRSCKFNFTMNPDTSRGELVFIYENLKVDFQGDIIKSKAGQSIFEAIANHVIIMPSNPYYLKTKTGSIYFTRNKYKSFTFNWLHSVLDGIGSTVLPNIIQKKEHKGRRTKTQ